MYKRKIAALALVFLLAFSITPVYAADTPQEYDTAPLRLELKQDETPLACIMGLTAGQQAIPADTLLPLIKSVTSDTAKFTSGSITPATPAATGLTVEWAEGGGADAEASLVVYGDVIGTGTLSLSQLTRMTAAFTGADPLEGAFLEAADVSRDGSGLTLTDIVIEANMVTYVPAIGEEASDEIIREAVDTQAGDGSSYHADVFHVLELHKGDVIYGMLPGQSAFYTDAETVEACGGSYTRMYGMLQMLPHPEFGYREQLGTYTVKEDTWVAAGYCLANSQIDGTYSGPGGGFQFVIPEFEAVLELTDTVDLHA